MNDQNALARGRVDIAQQRLLRRYPLHAHVAARWRPRCEPRVGTAGVTVERGELVLLYAPDFILQCTFPELTGVLLHEAGHVLFRHPLTHPERYPDEHARIVAEEVTVNEFIVDEPLPGSPILLAQFPELPPRESTQTRYARLARHSAKRPASDPRSTVTGIIGDGEHREGIVPLDNHDVWQSAREAGVLAELILDVTVREAARELTQEQWDALPAELRNAVKRACGNSPGGMVESVGNHALGHLNWQRLLRRYVADLRDRRPTLVRPSRRAPQLVGVVAGRHRQADRFSIVVVLDTSGSMSRDALSAIDAELRQLARRHVLHIVECDTQVHRTRPFTGRIETVLGRGGTDLRPAFAPDLLRRLRPSLVIACTDGFGPVPEKAPPVPVIWLLTPAGQKPAPWGREIRLPDVAESQFERNVPQQRIGS